MELLNRRNAVEKAISEGKWKDLYCTFSFDATGTHSVDLGVVAKVVAAFIGDAEAYIGGFILEVWVSTSNPLTQITIEGPDEVSRGGSGQYTGYAHYWDGTKRPVSDLVVSVEWAASGAYGVGIDSNGKLTALPYGPASDASIRLTCTSFLTRQSRITRVASKSVAIATVPGSNRCPTLSQGSHSPNGGITPSTPVAFFVYYLDPDGNAPTQMDVVVDGATRIPMQMSTRGSCGETFCALYASKARTFSLGNHTYRFEFSDGTCPVDLTQADFAFVVSDSTAWEGCYVVDGEASPRSFPASGGTGTITITNQAGSIPICPWIAWSTREWVKIESHSSSTAGNATLTFSVLPNDKPKARGCNIWVGPEGGGATGLKLRIEQEGMVCSYSLDQTEISAAAEGGTWSVGVSAQSTCTWTASSNASWIQIVSSSTGTGNGTVWLSVTRNTDAAARTGTLTVAGQTVTVSQEGVGCSFNVHPTSATLQSTGGGGSISVSTLAGCSWTASSNVDWARVTEGSSGTGPGSVRYEVDAHAGGMSRTGTLTVAGTAVTINQEAQKNSCPTLGSPEVRPGTGTPQTDFMFYVRYSDANGDTPSKAEVRVGTATYSMKLLSGSASNGLYVSDGLRFTPGTYTAEFVFSDGSCAAESVQAGFTVQGNACPQLTEGRVEPTSGTPTTQFTFRVRYQDADGDAPTVKRVVVDGQPQTMNLESGSAANGGYVFGPRTYAAGEHRFFFEFDDGKCGPVRTVEQTFSVDTTYTVSGRVTTSGGAGLSGVTITFTRVSGSGATPSSVTTDANGNWTRTEVPTGSTYRATPSRSGYSFSPTHVDFSSARSDLNFTGTTTPPPTYTVSGRVTTSAGAGVSGVTITFTRVSGSGAIPSSVTTDGSGNWTRTEVPTGSTYRAAPSRSGYSFNPTHLDFSSARSDLNFTGTPAQSTGQFEGYAMTRNRYRVEDVDLDAVVQAEFGAGAAVADWQDIKRLFSGRAREFADGIGLYVIGDDGVFVRNGGNGYYSGTRHYYFCRFDGNPPGHFMIHDHIDNRTLCLGSWYGKSMPILVKLPTGPSAYTVSGRVTTSTGAGLSGVTIAFTRVSGSGAIPSSVTTDGSGNWTRTEVPTGSTYRAAPSRSGYSFNPTHLDFSSARSDLNFTSTGGEPPGNPITLQIWVDKVEGKKVTVNGYVATTDGTVQRMLWEWGDGSTEESWFPASHTYVHPGIYTVRVTAFSSSGRTRVETLSVTVAGGVPSAPQNVAAACHGGSVLITWGAVDGATNYDVFRSTTATGAYVLLGMVGATSFSDTGVTVGGTYWYRIRASNSYGTSPFSAPVSATVLSESSINLTGTWTGTIQLSGESGPLPLRFELVHQADAIQGTVYVTNYATEIRLDGTGSFRAGVFHLEIVFFGTPVGTCVGAFDGTYDQARNELAGSWGYHSDPNDCDGVIVPGTWTVQRES